MVVCSSLVAPEVRRLAAKGTQIIVDDRTLNRGSMKMLQQRLARLGPVAGTKETGRVRR